jgi:ABC-type glycerol-3-phosphate transport system substrate-binding protein
VIPGLRRLSIALALVLAACSSAAPPSPSGPEKVAITAKTASELLAVMNAWQAAIAKKDLTGFQATIDLTRAAFRRCQAETFDIAARQGFTPLEV